MFHFSFIHYSNASDFGRYYLAHSCPSFEKNRMFWLFLALYVRRCSRVVLFSLTTFSEIRCIRKTAGNAALPKQVAACLFFFFLFVCSLWWQAIWGHFRVAPKDVRGLRHKITPKLPTLPVGASWLRQSACRCAYYRRILFFSVVTVITCV